MTDAPAAVVTIEGLTVRRPHEVLLDNVSLQVRRGSIHVIVGPNGAGKSTLIGALLGHIPFEGRIGLDWLGNGAIGYVPQSFAVDPTLPVTVADFLALTRQRRPVCLGVSRQTRRAVAGLLERVGLPDLAQRPLAVLSGGEIRRVLLAHALDPMPELLVLDEASAGVDESAARQLDDLLLASVATGQTTVLMVSHDREQVRRVADRVTMLNRKIVLEGSAEIVAGAAPP